MLQFYEKIPPGKKKPLDTMRYPSLLLYGVHKLSLQDSIEDGG